METYHVHVRYENGLFVGKVMEREGVISRGQTLNELVDALRTAIGATWGEREVQLELLIRPQAPEPAAAAPATQAFVSGRTEFLIGQAAEASKLFWIRMNVFLTIQAVWLTGAFAWVAKAPHPTPGVACLFASFGIPLCLLWIPVIRISDWYHLIQVRDARAAAFSENKTEDYYCSLNLENHWPEGRVKPIAPTRLPFPPRPWGRRAVYWLYAVTALFGVAWIVLIFAAKAAADAVASTPPHP